MKTQWESQPCDPEWVESRGRILLTNESSADLLHSSPHRRWNLPLIGWYGDRRTEKNPNQGWIGVVWWETTCTAMFTGWKRSCQAVEERDRDIVEPKLSCCGDMTVDCLWIHAHALVGLGGPRRATVGLGGLLGSSSSRDSCRFLDLYCTDTKSYPQNLLHICVCQAHFEEIMM